MLCKEVISYSQVALAPAKEPSHPEPANRTNGGTKSGLPFRKKILYYGLMLLLTLLALEGMARLAYYAAYGQGYGSGGSDAPVEFYTPRDATEELRPWEAHHPFYGFTNSSPGNALNAMPPRQRREGTVVIGLVGGSVAYLVRPFLQRALERWYAANNRPQQPVVLTLAKVGMKQPQQTLIVANTLLLGGEFDLIVNLDGFNEIVQGARENLYVEDGIFPFFPVLWDNRVALTAEGILLGGRIRVLRQEQTRLVAAGETSPLRWSAVFGLANRYRQERTGAEIIRLNHQLAAAESGYNLEKNGPRSWLEGEGELLPEEAKVWYRGSVALARLAELAGADYYHFLQPNQYVPGSKPLSPEELASAYDPIGPHVVAGRGYPLLWAFSRDLQGLGINYFDLTGIFADHPETLYINDCCHVNDRGNELLAAEMVQRLEPALLRLGDARRAGSVSALTAARSPAEGPAPLNTPEFQVSLSADGKQLQYIREGCAEEDTEHLFFLRLTPQDLTDLPPHNRELGIDHRSFSFAEAGGNFARWQCTLQFPLPDYPIAALRTGQHIPGQGELWSAELFAAADPAQLRAIYAALSAEQPVARDYFDLYLLGHQLIYLRESCTAADTAADFFLPITPEDPADLPAERRDAYFNHWGFNFVHGGFDFARYGGHFDGKCLASVPLPDYPIAALRTGQHIPGQGDVWSVDLVAAADPEELRANYAALSAMQPAARDYFDLYRRDNQLLYLRKSCADDDTAAGFFLYVFPEDLTNLPEQWRSDGNAYLGFNFVRWGGHFDGKCLAAVPLPDYPIKKIRTGQYVPGQGDLWSVTIAAP